MNQNIVNLGQMTVLVPILLLGWLPVVLVLFALKPARRAVTVSLLAAWLILPVAVFNLRDLPPYSKMTASCLGILLATAMFDSGRFLNLRFRWPDLFMLGWLAVAMISSLNAGRGPYDGGSMLLRQTVEWGLPYLVGRLYFSTLEDLHYLGLMIVISALIYVPLCLYEIRFGPTLHNMLYGFNQHDFIQSRRGTYYRPMVFMEHGLAVGVFMCSGALLAYWFWLTGAARHIWGVPMSLIALVLGVTAFACQSWGATLLGLVGAASLTLTRQFRVWALVLVLIAIPTLYIGARSAGWDGAILVDAASLLGEQRQASLSTRLNSENAFLHVAGPSLLLGASRFVWAGQYVAGDNGVLQRIIPDGFWLVAMGRNGIVGLGLVMCAILVPVYLLTRRVPARLAAHPQVAATTALAVIVALWMCDNLSNAMINPIWIAIAGGLTNITAKHWGVVFPAPSRPEPQTVPTLGAEVDDEAPSAPLRQARA